MDSSSREVLEKKRVLEEFKGVRTELSFRQRLKSCSKSASVQTVRRIRGTRLQRFRRNIEPSVHRQMLDSTLICPHALACPLFRRSRGTLHTNATVHLGTCKREVSVPCRAALITFYGLKPARSRSTCLAGTQASRPAGEREKQRAAVRMRARKRVKDSYQVVKRLIVLRGFTS